MSVEGTKVFLGNIEITPTNLFLGSNSAQINPFTKQFPTSGLIAAFDVTNIQSYPGSGSVWNDLSTNRLVATTFSSSTFPTYNSTDFEFTFAGDGATANALYAYISSSVATGSIIQDFTQIVWAKQPDAGTGAERGIVNLQNTLAGSVIFDGISFNQDTNRFRLTSANADRNVTADVQETVFNSYLMIASTRTSGTNNFRIYREGGNLIGSGSFTPLLYAGTAANGLAILIGNRFFNNPTSTYVADGWWSGSLSSIIMYNRALSSDELDSIYKLGRFGIEV